MHDFGLFTLGSQPYEHKPAHLLDGKWTEGRQRLYVSFYATRRYPALRVLQQTKRNDVVVCTIQLYPFNEIAKSHNEGHSISKERAAITVADLEFKEWKTAGGVYTVIDVSDDGFYKLDAMKHAKPIHFDVAAQEWVSLDLLGMIENVAIECGLPCVCYDIALQPYMNLARYDTPFP